MQSLLQWVNEFECRPPMEHGLCVVVCHSYRKAIDGKPERLQRALEATTPNERLEIVKRLLGLWVSAEVKYTKTGHDEALDVFGCMMEHGGEHLFYTLTADGRELRVWYDFPACMYTDHVDSRGINCLIHVGGEKAEVAKYLAAFQDVCPLEGVALPNGVQLFIYRMSRNCNFS